MRNFLKPHMWLYNRVVTGMVVKAVVGQRRNMIGDPYPLCPHKYPSRTAPT
jgi:hypothetical protein